MASIGAVATKANAEAVVDGVTNLSTPHALLGMASVFFCDAIMDGGVDLLDPCSRERGGNVEGGVNVPLEASKGVGSSKASQAAVESLPLHL